MAWLAAIVGIVLLIIFPKQVLSLVGILLLIGVGIYFYFQEEGAQREREKDRVAVSVKFTIESCSEEYPLSVVIRNNGNKVVNKVSWNFAAYQSGYSSNIVSYSGGNYSWSSPYTTDKILNPNDAVGFCYKVPHLTSDIDKAAIVYEITNKSVVFAN